MRLLALQVLIFFFSFGIWAAPSADFQTFDRAYRARFSAASPPEVQEAFEKLSGILANLNTGFLELQSIENGMDKIVVKPAGVKARLMAAKYLGLGAGLSGEFQADREKLRWAPRVHLGSLFGTGLGTRGVAELEMWPVSSKPAEDREGKWSLGEIIELSYRTDVGGSPETLRKKAEFEVGLGFDGDLDGDEFFGLEFGLPKIPNRAGYLYLRAKSLYDQLHYFATRFQLEKMNKTSAAFISTVADLRNELAGHYEWEGREVSLSLPETHDFHSIEKLLSKNSRRTVFPGFRSCARFVSLVAGRLF